MNDTVSKNDPKVEVCVNEKKTIQQCLGMLRVPESTFHKIVTRIFCTEMQKIRENKFFEPVFVKRCFITKFVGRKCYFKAIF